MLNLEQPRTLEQLARAAGEALGAHLALLGGGPETTPPIKLFGDPGVSVSALSAYEEAGPGALTFAISPAYLKAAEAAGATAVIVPPDLAEGGELNLPALITREPRLVFAVLLGLLGRPQNPCFAPGEAFFVDRESVSLGVGVILGHGVFVGPRVKIGRGTVVAPGAYLEDGVEIGEDCVIHPRVILRWGVKIGNRCQIHAGAVLGDDGFGYSQLPDPARGRLLHVKNAHLGGLAVGDDVEIGALAAIDRGLVADTVIGDGTKIDNLVQIGHNCRIGRDCIIVAQTGIGGHAAVGPRVFLLGQAGLGPGVTIGDDAIISAQSGVGSGSIPAGRVLWSGSPARPNSETYQTAALSFSQLPRLKKFFSLFKKSESFAELKEEFFNSKEDKK